MLQGLVYSAHGYHRKWASNRKFYFR